MERKRKYRCASCGNTFYLEEQEKEVKCPDCRSRTLIVLEGEPRKKKAGCAPSG